MPPQSAIERLAEEFAGLAERGDRVTLDRRCREEGARWGCAPWTIVGLVAGEWDRTGVARVPGFMELPVNRSPLLRVLS